MFEQIYDPEMKSLVMPKLYPSVSPYSIFGNTRFSRERYMFYEPLIRDLTFPQSKSFSEPPNLASTKLLNPKPPTPRPGQKPAEVSPEALLQSVLYTSSILYFEMMECYATLVFRLMERAQLFDLIHYTEQKNSVFSSILSSVDIWKDNMLMDVPFHLIISWYLKVNDIDLRFVNKYISRHCLNIKSQIYKRPRSYEIYIHPKVKRAEKKFVEIDHPVFTNYLKAAKMFFPKDRYRGARRKGFHCYFIGAGNTLKNKRFKNNILSKRFWKRRRKLRYNCLLQKLMIKKLYSAKPYHRFRDFFRDTSSKSDILRNYSFFYKYFNDLDNYIGFSDIGLMKCPHARSEEKCYKASKYVADTILKTFFNLIDKCSRIKKWLLKRFVPELENFFEMMLEIVKIASCKNIAYKIGRRHENWMKSAPYRESIIQEKLSSSEDISSSDSSMFGKLHRSFSHVHKRYKEEDHEKRETWQESNLESNQPKKINKNKYSSFPSMVLLRLMNIIPILNNDFIFSDLSAFGNTFVDRYTRETSDIQGVDFIKYRLPTEIRRVVTTANEDSSEILKPAKISRGLSRIIAGKDRTYEKYISLIKPPLKEMMAKANNPTVVANDGRKAVSETVITSHFMDTKSVDENGHSFPSPDQLKAPRSYPNLLDGPSVRLSDAPTNRSQPFTPFTLNPIVIYLMSLFSSKMFNKYKELCFLQNYLIIGKPLGRYFQKIKKSESIQIYKSRMSVIKSVRSSQQIKLSVSYKEKKSVKKLPDKWLKRNRDVRYLLSCQVGYLSGLLKSVVDRELAKAGLYDSDESSVSSPCSDSVESLDSVSTGYLPPDLYKMFGVIKTKDEYKYTSQSDAWSTSSSSSTHQQHRVPPSSALPNVSRKSVSSVGTSTPTRKVPLTMDNVTFFRMAMYAILNSLRAHILDLSNYPVEKLFPCLGDLRIPTVTQLMLELYTWSIPDFKSDSDSDESYDDPSEAQEALETSDNTLLYDDSDNANNIDIEPSGSVLNIKMKSYSELNPISDLRASESLDEIAEIQNNKYDIFHRVISEPSYCLLPPDFIDSFLGIIEEGARKGGILNPLFINRAYYEALERYSRQIEHLPYHRPTIPQLSHPNNIKQSQTKRQKEVNFLDFFLDLANTFVDILYR